MPRLHHLSWRDYEVCRKVALMQWQIINNNRVIKNLETCDADSSHFTAPKPPHYDWLLFHWALRLSYAHRAPSSLSTPSKWDNVRTILSPNREDGLARTHYNIKLFLLRVSARELPRHSPTLKNKLCNQPYSRLPIAVVYLRGSRKIGLPLKV